jgi:hypothetical protein
VSLLKEIYNDATDSRVDIITVLRKAKILAARLNNPEFSAWIEHELNGYPSRDEVPPYRILPALAKGNYMGRYGHQLRNTEIMASVLPPEFRHWGTTMYLTDPMSFYGSIVKNAVAQGESEIQAPWPQELAVRFGSKLYRNMQCISAWQVISVDAIVAVMETVRNRILSFALEIEQDAPEAGEAAPKTEPVPQERIRQVFTTIVTGGVNNIAAGGSDFSQANYGTVQEGDIQSLQRYLSAVGIEAEDIACVAQDLESAPTHEGKIQLAKNWLADLTIRAASKVGEFATMTAISLAAKGLFAYLAIAFPGGG